MRKQLWVNTPLVEPLRKCSLSQNTYQKVYLGERDASTGLTRLSLSDKNLEVYLFSTLGTGVIKLITAHSVGTDKD